MASAPSVALAVVVVAFATTGCPAPPKEGKYPARKEGCDVKVFPENPTSQTDNIGPVTATCSESTTNDDCLRTLKDETCKLGGDIVWGVSDTPENVLGKKRFTGRAAHTKVAAPQ